MKGVVFTEYLDMVEQMFGYDMVDSMIEESNLPSGGIYTAVGTYEFNELLSMVIYLHKKTKVPIKDLLKTFGKHLFKTFLKNYSAFFERVDCGFKFLASIDHHIHVEVKKLYPDAELPKFSTNQVGENTLEMVYYSERRLGDFAFGLIESTMEHYNQACSIKQQSLNDDGSEVKFVIVKQTTTPETEWKPLKTSKEN